MRSPRRHLRGDMEAKTAGVAAGRRGNADRHAGKLPGDCNGGGAGRAGV